MCPLELKWAQLRNGRACQLRSELLTHRKPSLCRCEAAAGFSYSHSDQSLTRLSAEQVRLPMLNTWQGTTWYRVPVASSRESWWLRNRVMSERVWAVIV